VFIAIFVTCFSIPTISFAAFEHGSTPHVLTDPATQGDRVSQPDTIAASMLRGVAIRDGKNSVEYVKAGGSNRKKGGRSTRSITVNTMVMATAISPAQVTPSR
jgi:hypothetical protein